MRRTSADGDATAAAAAATAATAAGTLAVTAAAAAAGRAAAVAGAAAAPVLSREWSGGMGSAARTLVTPALTPGKQFVYTLTAEINNGKGPKQTKTEEITVRAGQVTRVNLTFPATVASK